MSSISTVIAQLQKKFKEQYKRLENKLNVGFETMNI